MNLCLFDLDKTLIPIDSDYEWGKFLVRKKVVNVLKFVKSNKMWYKKYLLGTLDAKKYLEFVFKTLSKFSLLQLNELRENFIKKVILPSLKLEAINLVNKHINSGDIVIIVTATNKFITEPIAKLFNVKNLIAATPEISKDGLITGKLVGRPTYGADKVIHVINLLKNKYKKSIFDFKKSFFYSDSENDIPLLSFVNNPIVTNASKKLKIIALLMNWPIINLFNY